ncbi:MAG: hypothetical protein ACRDSR_07255 [Pseudonocardiaceae bacterium]
MNGGHGVALVAPHDFVGTGAGIHEGACGYCFAFTVDVESVVIFWPPVRADEHYDVSGGVA